MLKTIYPEHLLIHQVRIHHSSHGYDYEAMRIREDEKKFYDGPNGSAASIVSQVMYNIDWVHDSVWHTAMKSNEVY